MPIRTYYDWDEDRTGFVEIDLVRHEAQVWVFETLLDISKSLPFAVKGIDSDNSSEFINYRLIEYCQEKKITFNR